MSGVHIENVENVSDDDNYNMLRAAVRMSMRRDAVIAELRETIETAAQLLEDIPVSKQTFQSDEALALLKSVLEEDAS